MALVPGSRIGQYQVTARIGAGGMGEVYRATDTKLGREVAIKTLPTEVAADADRLARFRREAQLLASLNHPNIAAIHGLEEAAGIPYLVLELVEGEDLAQRLARGPIPPDEAIDIARRIAEALEEAHDQGIVHRDLKPANVKLAPDGKVKVLDFGLAKAFTASAAPGSGGDLSQSPTLVQSGTQAGVILGTAAYMSPEQARGRAVDRRADIWAFGAVLWEMLAGRPLFSGETLSDIIAAVLTRDPVWTALPAATPSHVVRLLRRCLERDPRRRLQAIGEARIDLERGAGDAGDPSTVHSTPAAAAAPGWWRPAGLALLAALLGVAATLALRPEPSAPPALPGQVTFNLDPPERHFFTSGLALSRDGRSLAFVLRDPEGQTALWVRSLDTVEPRRITGTENARFPFWAPDGRRLGFFAGGELKVVDLIGGAVRSLARTDMSPDVRGATWGAGDVIVFAPRFTGGLLQINASEGTPAAPATQLDATRQEGTHRWPSFLPDGRRFLFYAAKGTGTEPGEVRLGTVGSGVAHTLTPAHSGAVFLPPRFILFVLGQSLVAQEIDLDRPRLVGEPRPLDVELQGSIGISGFRSLSAAGTGTLAYRQTQGTLNHLVWVDREGRELSTLGDDGDWHFGPRLSPDGGRIAVVHYAAGTGHGGVHVHDPGRHLDTRVTFGEHDDGLVAWSRDGRTLAVSSISPGAEGIYEVDPARPGERRLRHRADRLTYANDWFPDGGLLLSIASEDSRTDLHRLPPGENVDLVSILASPFSEDNPSLTPDGRWLAYVGDSTGASEIYVRALDSGEEWRVSKTGGVAPLWRRDGRELYYLDGRGYIVAVPTTIGTSFSMGTPTPLFPGLLDEATGRQYDVTPAGRRFILNRSKEATNRPIVMMLGLPEKILADRRPGPGGQE